MVVKSGVGYYTGSSDIGHMFGPKLDKKGQVPSYLIEFDADNGGGMYYSVIASSFGILIRTPLHRCFA
jgi:hypothetical protein